ncbi:multiheme c-type cytochrome [Phaeovulum sp.]|uniref:multiheme c-type cytochrome n=1 Tax=Phaeovulum sp. TaxID=2934796 RepID=UPI0039E3DD21
MRIYRTRPEPLPAESAQATTVAATIGARFAMALFLGLFALVPVAAALAETTVPEYVGSAACVECHKAVADAWANSDHALAWTLPGPSTVMADFDHTSFEGSGISVQFRIEEGTYHAHVTEMDGTTRDYPVHSVAGIEPLQQYLLETEPGRLQSFDVAWDTEQKRWFHLYPDQSLPPDNGLHWTGPYKTWNARCAACHATGYDKNYSPVTRSYKSTSAEIGVGCEACHGPGQAHLDWSAGKAVAPGLSAYGFSMDFSKGAEATIQQCAGCHSRREAFDDGNPLPGTPYHDAYNLSLLYPDSYHADGQILDEAYVYGLFLQSKMYQAGVSCVNCHDAHTTKLKAEGNAVCTQCHSPAGNPDFPSVTPKDYDSVAHHFHEPGTAGAECKNCHMVERRDMGNDWRADHSFRIPRPDLASATGAPDACTTCHTDQSADWAAKVLVTRFPESRHRGPHYGETLARGRMNPVTAQGDLTALAKDTAQPGIVRATALWLVAQGADAATAQELMPLLDDPDPLVRASAIQAQQGAPQEQRLQRLAGLLSDPVRAVRIEAAKALLGGVTAGMPPEITSAHRAALADWQKAISHQMDFPETQLVLGGIALTMRNLAAAESAFFEAVRMDPQRAEAWEILVRIASASRGPDAARQILAKALAILPDNKTLRQYEVELAPQ